MIQDRKLVETRPSRTRAGHFSSRTLAIAALAFSAGVAAQTERVSVATGGEPGNGDSHGVDISGDGRFVAFGSRASNLVPGGTTVFDIYVRDRSLGLTELVSKNDQGQSGNSTSLWPSISSDGRYVTFSSIARNLVPGDDNGNGDVFLYDRELDTITLVSRALDGSPGDGRSQRAEISADGSFVAFESSATDLVAGVPDGITQIYGYDVATGAVSLLSRDENGAPATRSVSAPSVSRDGNLILFRTFASLTSCPPDCGYLYIRNRATKTTSVVPEASDFQTDRASLSGDGRYVAWSTNARTFLVDRVAGTRTTLDQADLSRNPRSWSRFSDDGRFFVFWEAQTSSASGPYRLWRYNRTTGLAEIVSLDSDGDPISEGARSPGTFGPPAISDDGTIVAFWSELDGIVDGDTGGIEDVYVSAVSGDPEAPRVGSITFDPAEPLARTTFTVSATADDSASGAAAIISGAFAIDGGDWLPATPADGAFDSPLEVIERSLGGLAPGPYEVCVRATDGFGNVSDGLDCAKLTVARNPDVIEVTIPLPPLFPGGTIDASAGGFKPLSLVRAYLESTPVLVGEENADDDGFVAFSLTVPETFPPGEHTLALEGIAPNDDPRRLTTPITVSLQPLILRSGFEPRVP